MELTYEQMDVTPFEEQRMKPIRMLPRKAQDQWHVVEGPVDMTKPLDLSLVRMGDAVRIPLVPYLTNPEPAQAIAYMMGLTAYATAQLPRNVSRMHIVTAVPLQLISDEHGEPKNFRFWAGFAYQLQRGM